MVSIYLYYANIIDYGRFILLFLAVYFHDKNPIAFMTLYFSSFALDLFDGMAARYFNQFSRIGSALDMICDRLTTAALLTILGKLYPEYFLAFVFLLMLDVGSHWLQVYSSLVVISEDKSVKNHKEIKEKFWLLDLYYHNKIVLFSTCLFAELFLIFCYVNYHYPHIFEGVYSGLFYFSFGIYCFKQVCSVFQIIGAAERLVEYENLNRIK